MNRLGLGSGWAVTDLEAAVGWYNERVAGLGNDFSRRAARRRRLNRSFAAPMATEQLRPKGAAAL
jgi:hypothetical protein